MRAGFLASTVLAALAWTLVALPVREPPRPRDTTRRTLGQEHGTVWARTSPALRPLLVFAFASFAAVLGLRGLWGGPWLMETKGLARVEAGNLLLPAPAR